jgi:hypothetical protein
MNAPAAYPHKRKRDQGSHFKSSPVVHWDHVRNSGIHNSEGHHADSRGKARAFPWEGHDERRLTGSLMPPVDRASRLQIARTHYFAQIAPIDLVIKFLTPDFSSGQTLDLWAMFRRSNPARQLPLADGAFTYLEQTPKTLQGCFKNLRGSINWVFLLFIHRPQV